MSLTLGVVLLMNNHLTASPYVRAAYADWGCVLANPAILESSNLSDFCFPHKIAQIFCSYQGTE